MDLSILIPARNEEFLYKTIENILENMQGDTEVIAISDGYWPNPPIKDHPKVHIIHHSKSIGQRAATNEGATISKAKFIMKCDAHCAFDKGFDVKLMKDCEYDWTVVPRLYNLHAFDWKCLKCVHTWYQGPNPSKCEKCDNTKDFEREIIWKARFNRRSDFARFDRDLHFQYWHDYEKRPESKGDIVDLMCHVGACWMMQRQRYWDLGGMDEKHGSWGQMGVEISCKTWLGGGRQVVNKKTWYSHLFRTQPGFSFPYPNPGIEKARERSKWLWEGNNWSGAKYPLEWLIKKFAPVPEWELKEVKNHVRDVGNNFGSGINLSVGNGSRNDLIKRDFKKISSKGLIYYTDNELDPIIMKAVQDQIKNSVNGLPIVSSSLKPIDFGENKVINDRKRGRTTMFMEILSALERSKADIIFFCEHDVLYHPSHFEFIPPQKDVFYYNENTYKVDAKTGQALFYYTKQTSGLCGYRELLLEHYKKRVERCMKEGKYDPYIGYEPGCHHPPRGIDDYKAERWMSKYPNIDIRHSNNLTPSRWNQDQFRNKKNCEGWTMADSVNGWGITRGRFEEILRNINA